MISKIEYPKVLVIDPTPFNRNRNNGILKSNLFQGWPKDRIAQIDYSNIQPSFDVCEQYWRLRKWDIVKGLFGIVQNNALSIPQNDCDSYNPDYTIEYDDRPKIERVLSKLSFNLRTTIGEVILRLPTALSYQLLRWIDNFNPDVLFSVLSTAPIVRFVVKVSQHKNIPIVPLFTDDWVETLYKNHNHSGLLRKSLLHWFNKCLTRSPIRFCMNDCMSLEYTKRYGGRFETMLSPEEIRPYVKTFRSIHSSPVRLVYIGGLVPHRWVTLRQIGEALYDLRSRGIAGELLIYTYASDIQRHKSALTLDPVLRLMGTARPEDVSQIQAEADALVHVESFDRFYQQWTALSLSTKIPQYLMAGGCIFAYGPESVASMEYLIGSGTALTVGKEDPTTLCATLNRLIEDAKLRRHLSKRAHDFALKYHDATKQRDLFRNYILEACNLWGNF